MRAGFSEGFLTDKGKWCMSHPPDVRIDQWTAGHSIAIRATHIPTGYTGFADGVGSRILVRADALGKVWDQLHKENT